MNARALFVTGAVATLLVAAVPPAQGKPGRARADRDSGVARAMASGLGTRNDALRYVSIPPAAFGPMLSTETHAIGSAATLAKAIAPVSLPDGARVRDLACFGRWDPAHNLGKKIRLQAASPAEAGHKSDIAVASVGKGEGVRRIDATADHVVDNFANTYQLIGVFNTPAALRGCRIAYEL
jgi:hypothetical protein